MAALRPLSAVARFSEFRVSLSIDAHWSCPGSVKTFKLCAGGGLRCRKLTRWNLAENATLGFEGIREEGGCGEPGSSAITLHTEVRW